MAENKNNQTETSSARTQDSFDPLNSGSGLAKLVSNPQGQGGSSSIKPAGSGSGGSNPQGQTSNKK